MKVAQISQVKDQLSAYIKEVEAGETILILNRDRPVATLGPPPEIPKHLDEGLALLERAGIIRRARLPPDPALAHKPLAPAPPGADLLSAVLEERGEGW